MRSLPIRWLLVCVALLLGACNATPRDDNASTPTLTPSPAPTATIIPTVEATPQDVETLTLWLPDELMGSINTEDTVSLLGEQIAAFGETRDDLTIEIRRKQVREAGGILQTLRTAKDVAPSVLPDLTLIRRDGLLAAVAEGLVEPMEGVVSTAIIGDLFSSALDAGQVNGTLYALPYALEVHHVVYAPGQIPRPEAQLSAYLEGDVSFLFPAVRASGLNTVFFTQYLAANPRVVDTGALTIDEDALLALFEYYEAAAQVGLVPPEVTSYTSPQDYRSVLQSGEFDSAVVSSGLYLQMTDNDLRFGVGSIPTLEGQPATTLDGWMWVMTTANPNRQALGGSFLEWMMDADRQGEYVRSLELLPSQRTALRRWYSEDYAEFLLQIIPNATLPYNAIIAGAPARAVQNALMRVLAGELTAAEATQDVIGQMSD